jgi:hypothetical protein
MLSRTRKWSQMLCLLIMSECWSVLQAICKLKKYIYLAIWFGIWNDLYFYLSILKPNTFRLYSSSSLLGDFHFLLELFSIKVSLILLKYDNWVGFRPLPEVIQYIEKLSKQVIPFHWRGMESDRGISGRDQIYLSTWVCYAQPTCSGHISRPHK